MWVRTQNKKEVVEIGRLKISKNIGGIKKFTLLGFTKTGFFGSDQIVLGFYIDEQSALKELDDITSNFNPNTIYHVK